LSSDPSPSCLVLGKVSAMNETSIAETTSESEKPRRFHFDWLLPAVIRPRKTFEQIAHAPGSVWLAPIVVLMALALARVMAAGVIQQATGGGINELPPDFQYWSPDQQAQFQQAAAMTSNPVFVFVFPAIITVLTIWVSWLIVGGLLNLSMALFGARGGGAAIMNLAAWSFIPFGVRDVVQTIALIATQRPIQGAGLAGFAPADGGILSAIIVIALGLIDLYVIWHVILLRVGVGATGGLSSGRAWASTLLVMFLSLAGQMIIGFIGLQLSQLTVGRFFF